MKVPISWLKDFVDITLPIHELAERLTFAGLEVEDIEYIGVAAPSKNGAKSAGLAWDREKIFVAQLVDAQQHPNADRLKIVRVDYGHGEPVQMVTGAPNIGPGDSGQKVVLALEGSRLYDGHKEGREADDAQEIQNSRCRVRLDGLLGKRVGHFRRARRHHPPARRRARRHTPRRLYGRHYFRCKDQSQCSARPIGARRRPRSSRAH